MKANNFNDKILQDKIDELKRVNSNDIVVSVSYYTYETNKIFVLALSKPFETVTNTKGGIV